METLELDGEWTLRRMPGGSPLKARVPGCVHTDLLAAGTIPDPFFGENEVDLQWIGKSNWAYTRAFDVPSSFLEADRVYLRCDGLDTFASLRMNGRRIGVTDNQFRTWEFDVRLFLRAGRNVIEIRLASPLSYQAKKIKDRGFSIGGSVPHEWAGRSYVRKSPCNYGWDWGAALPTCGLWRSPRLVAFSGGRLRDIQVRQDHSRPGAVSLDILIEAEVARPAPLDAACHLSLGGRRVAEATVRFRRGRAVARLQVAKPRLWWPNGMGAQPLYELNVDLLDATGELLDTDARRVGLRTLKLVRQRDRWGESFHFAANGVPFFAKGANWIPADQFPSRIPFERYAHLLRSAAAAHMNMLRVWGGGIYEDNAFYDLCDELGLCVWQDFMFACAAYPSDAAFLDNVRAEAEDNIRRLRHHPCLALWCGNNELEQGGCIDDHRPSCMTWKEYKTLFDRLLPAAVKKLDPDRDYWPSSPHSPHGNRNDHSNPNWGDAHLWSVWHGRKPFEWYRTAFHRFCSEFGFQSFPEPRTVRGYTRQEDRNITSPVMEHHQRSGIGNAVIMQYLLEWFRMPRDFENTLWLSQILQSLAIRYAVDHWRRHSPRCMGALYWQLNDTWPVASWSSIDYHGRWKALHFAARQFYAPVSISGVEDIDKGSVDVHLVNDLDRALSGYVRWTVTSAAGELMVQDRFPVRIGVRTAAKVKVLDLAQLVQAAGKRNLLVWLEFEVRRATVSSALVSFVRPKHLTLRNPRLRTVVQSLGDNRFSVTCTARAAALWTWIELDGVDAAWSDNFFHLRPGVSLEVEATPAEELSTADFRKRLRVRSLFDTY